MTRIGASSKITMEVIREVILVVGNEMAAAVVTESHLNSSSRIAVGREMPMVIMVTAVLLERRRRFQ